MSSVSSHFSEGNIFCSGKIVRSLFMQNSVLGSNKNTEQDIEQKVR